MLFFRASWNGLKHATTAFWRSGTFFSGAMNHTSLSDSLMDKSGFGWCQENATHQSLYCKQSNLVADGYYLEVLKVIMLMLHYNVNATFWTVLNFQLCGSHLGMTLSCFSVHVNKVIVWCGFTPVACTESSVQNPAKHFKDELEC